MSDFGSLPFLPRKRPDQFPVGDLEMVRELSTSLLDKKSWVPFVVQEIAAKLAVTFSPLERVDFFAERFFDRSASGIPCLVGVEERTTPDQSRAPLVPVVGDMNSSRESRQNRLRSRALEKRTHHDGAVRRDEVELAAAAFREAWREPLALRDEIPNRRDLFFGIAAENTRNGRMAARPERRHQSSGSISRRVQQIATKPLRPQTPVEVRYVERLYPERRLLAPC